MKIVASIKITVDRLQPGLYVRLPVKWNEHPFLFNSFKIKSQDRIQLIKHLGIQHVFLNPSLSDAQPLPPNLEENAPEAVQPSVDGEAEKLWQEKQNRIEKLNAYRRRVQTCEKEFERSLARMRAVVNKIRNRPLDAVGEATQLVDDIVD